MNKEERQSNIELLRIVAMFYIMLYHTIVYYIIPICGESLFWRGLTICLHTGVVLFVLISGYFRIKPSLRGISRLVLMVFFYYVPIQLMSSEWGGVRTLFPIANGPYWFIRVYLCFYLLVPMLNKYLDDISTVSRSFLLAALFFINVYIGFWGISDYSLDSGKNVCNFMLIYLIGDTIKKYERYIASINLSYFIVAYLGFNIAIYTMYMFGSHVVSIAAMWLSFSYNSPLIYLNAILLFLIFAKIRFSSKIVNKVAASMVSCYIICDVPYIRYQVLEPIVEKLCSFSGSTLILFLSILVYVIIIMSLCVFIDKLFTPIWILTKKMPAKALG